MFPKNKRMNRCSFRRGQKAMPIGLEAKFFDITTQLELCQAGKIPPCLKPHGMVFGVLLVQSSKETPKRTVSFPLKGIKAART